MEKINIAELLKDCPKGMELDCTMFEDVYFDCIDQEYGFIKCYIQDNDYKTSISFTEYGCYTGIEKSKCVIYPKGKTTWKGFQKPFKDGDIIYVRDEYSDATFTYVAILKQVEKEGRVDSHCFYNYEDDEFSTDDYLYDIYHIRLATEEEKQKLFDAIKANGYKWNTETKTLEKLEVNKFDISTLKPFESRVLVRSGDNSLWKPAIFGCYAKDAGFFALGGTCWMYCIPFENNEHLLSTTDDCDEYYKTWE